MEICKKNDNVKRNNFIDKIKNVFMKSKTEVARKKRQVVLVGNPNVGKSVIFNALTGSYVTVSNYPGTTVEITKGKVETENYEMEVIDTPGMYSIISITDEERVTRNILMNNRPDLVVHVIDAKNIYRMLPLTLQLIEAGFNIVLVLNIIDEANSLGITIDTNQLSKSLNIPVVESSAALNIGLNGVLDSIKEQLAYVA